MMKQRVPQQIQLMTQKLTAAAGLITRPILRGMAVTWAASPLGMFWATLPPKAKRAVKVFSITFWLCWFAGAAWAASSGGISNVFPARPGQTLANSVDPFQLWQDKTAEPPGNVPADVMIGLAGMIFIGVACIAWVVAWFMTGMIGGSSAFEGSVDVSPMLSSAMGELAVWLLPSCIAMGAIITYFDMLREKTSAWSGFLSFALVTVAALGLMMTPKAYTDALGMGRDIGQKVVSTVISASPASSKQPFEWETNYDLGAEGNSTKSFALQVQDGFWRTFIITPWCVGEFGGDMGLCKEHGAAVLKKGKYDERHKYYENEVINKQEKDSHIQKILKGDDWSGRVGLVLFGALIALIGSVLVLLLTVNALLAWFQAVLLLFLGVLFLPLGIIPGVSRTWAANWATRVVGAVLLNSMLMLLLVVTMGLVSSVAVSGVEWNQQLITESIILFAAFGLKGQIQQIVNAGGIGSGGFGQVLMIRALSRTGNMGRRAAKAGAESVSKAARRERPPAAPRPPRRAALGNRRPHYA